MVPGQLLADNERPKNWWQRVSEQSSSALENSKQNLADSWESGRKEREQVAKSVAGAWETTRENSAVAWQRTKEKSNVIRDVAREDGHAVTEVALSSAVAAWDATKTKTTHVWESTKVELSDAATATNEAVAKAAEGTSDFYAKYETEVNVVAVATVAIVGYLIYDSYTSDSSPPRQADNGLYAHIPAPASVASGREFTASQRSAFFQENMSRNGGRLVSDLSGEALTMPGHYVRGYVADPKEAQVDHIFPRSLGGSNSPSNAQILSREENISKGATTP